MRKPILMTVLLGIMIIWTMNSFAQYSDPRMTSIRFNEDKQFYDVPPGNLEYINPNQSHKVYQFRDVVVDVAPNFRVHPSNTTQSEVPITRGLDPNILFASANAIHFSPSLFISEGVYVSIDGGDTWFGSDSCKSSPITDHLGDPAPAIGPDGRFYMSFLGWNGGMKAAYSTDLGNTWSNSAILQSGSVDKNHTVVDLVSGSPYSGRVYVTWSDFNQSYPSATASYSTNGGVNWSAYQHINTNASGHYAQGVNGAIGPNGEVYVVWGNILSDGIYPSDYVGFAKSTDGGVTWTYNNNVYNLGGIPRYDFHNGIRVLQAPWMGVDVTGGTRNGWIYVADMDRGLAPAGNDADIVLHRSTDGGTTWSAGIRVNQDALNNGAKQYMPTLVVGSDGSVNIIYYDTRSLSGDSASVYIARSLDGGDSWIEIEVADHHFKPKPIAGLASGYQGDYIGIAESNGVIIPYWCSDKSGIYQAWATQVTFEPPCPVESASNPIPPSGATDVTINLAQLSWTNGAGANTNETYFGTNPTSLTLVQSGSLASAWTIDPSYLPLNYNTHYYWKIVEVGDTCNSSATFSFTTEQDPNFIIVTDTLYPQNSNYWTGTCNSSTKTQVSLVNAVSNNLGWMAFDISVIPDNATINSITFYGYLYNNSWPYWSITPMGSVNPITGTASAIYNQVSNNYQQGVAYSYNMESGTLTNGWLNRALETTALADLQSALAQDWFAIGIVEWEFSASYYVYFQGWAETNKPYLKVVYSYIVPVELTSFTATAVNEQVELKWNTATETNNRGFEVERMSAGGVFEQIGYVAGFGTTTESKAYSFVDSKLEAGNYAYRLKQIDFDGSYEYSNEVSVEVELPLEYTLEQNYPNPFNPSTTINYSIPEDGFVKLAVYNMLGEEVATIVNAIQKAGRYEVNFSATGLSSGVYVYRIEAANYTASKKLMLMK